MINKILNIGTEGFSEKDLGKIRSVNMMAIITMSSTLSYMLIYLFLDLKKVVFISILFILIYGSSFIITAFRKYRIAGIMIFLVYMVHVVLFASVIFNKNTGFHFFLFAVPPITFVVFNYENFIAKGLISATALGLFFFCEFYPGFALYNKLSETITYIFYLSAIIEILIGLSIIVIIYTRSIKKYDERQKEMINSLQKALSEVKELKGLLPICSSCKKIRDDSGYWNQIENFISEHSDAEFSHGLCPDCAHTLYPDLFDKA